jgi:hypothetical protein
MATWHCRRFPGTNSSKHEFSNRRTLQGTYFLRSSSPAHDPSSGHTLNQSIWPKPTKTFRRNPISGNQVYRKREMCNKTRQPPPPNSDEDILAPLPQTLFTFQPKPSDENQPPNNQVYRKHELCNKTRQPPPQNIRRRSSQPLPQPYSPSQQKHQMKVNSRVYDSFEFCRNRETCNKISSRN